MIPVKNLGTYGHIWRLGDPKHKIKFQSIINDHVILYQKMNHVQPQTDNLREIYSYVK